MTIYYAGSNPDECPIGMYPLEVAYDPSLERRRDLSPSEGKPADLTLRKRIEFELLGIETPPQPAAGKPGELWRAKRSQEALFHVIQN